MYDVTNLETCSIQCCLLDQCGRECSVSNFAQVFLKNAADNSFTVQDYDLSSRSNLLIAYKCLKINLIDLSCHCIVVNFLDQDIIYLPLNVEIDLAAFMFGL